MPYGKRSYRGKRRVSRRRRPAPSRGAVYGAAARQLYKDVAKLKNLINVEFKYHDYQSSNDLTTTPVINCINLVNEGDTDQTHDGSMFRMKSLQLGGRVSLGGTAANPVAYRMALVLDTDAAASTTAPTYNDIYDDTGDIETRFRNLDNKSRFIILKSWDGQLSPNGSEMRVFKYFRNLDLKTQIVGSATETNLRKNGLYLVMVSSAGVVNQLYLNVHTRIRYIDN